MYSSQALISEYKRSILVFGIFLLKQKISVDADSVRLLGPINIGAARIEAQSPRAALAAEGAGEEELVGRQVGELVR